MYICRKPPSKHGFKCKCMISCGSPRLAVWNTRSAFIHDPVISVSWAT
jgi:hypothetical protein